MNNKAILHLDLDTFFVSVERLINTELQGKPLLVGGLGEYPESVDKIIDFSGLGIHMFHLNFPIKFSYLYSAKMILILILQK